MPPPPTSHSPTRHSAQDVGGEEALVEAPVKICAARLTALLTGFVNTLFNTCR